MSYAVYGSKGTYTEQWATENKVPFYEITQETAIVEDIETIWDKYSYKPLEFDARGFNRTYQWYGSTDKIQGNYDDKPIANATDKTFNPDDYKSYPYYYCIMTSTDKDIDGTVVSEVTITSSMCENRLYYMFALGDTYIDFNEKLIFTQKTAESDILEILKFTQNASYQVKYSYTYNELCLFGTGSEVWLYTDDSATEIYAVILEGDINGDGAVDAIDLTEIEKSVNDHIKLTGNYYLAADLNRDEQLDVQDYSQSVNLVLSH